MDVACWSDYLCPWCYVGQARDLLFEEVGMSVVHRPYELHPEIGTGGRRVRPDGRLGPTFDRIEAECERVGLAFNRPQRMPNTRRALATAEWVRLHDPDRFRALHRGLFAAHFVDGAPLDDPAVLDDLVTSAGSDPDAVRAAVERGDAEAALEASMAEARERGVTSTPSWVIGELTIPGALDEDTMRRWLTRLAERAKPTS